MKSFNKIFLSFLFFSIISCAPKINYLGDSYSPTQNVDIFFDEHDINKEYKVMGLMKNEAEDLENDEVEVVKKAMIKKAKAVGADAILFVGFYSERIGNDNDLFDNVKNILEAKLLKYK